MNVQGSAAYNDSQQAWLPPVVASANGVEEK